jgi:UDPglucose 6-dehydrogenase
MIIGAGTVGFATGDGFARMGNEIFFYDKDLSKQETIKDYTVFTEGDHVSIGNIDIVFICVEEWNVEKVFEEWHERFQNHDSIVVIRSTVLPGTTENLRVKYEIPIFHNPEFLRERNALNDFLYPDKIVIGRNLILHTWDYFIESLYKPFNAPIIFTDSNVSEFLKLASNAVLSSYISTWNQLFMIADKIGISNHQIAKILTLDPRISKYGTIHGKKFGGFCLPKDLDSIIKFARELKLDTCLLEAIKKINEGMPE